MNAHEMYLWWAVNASPKEEKIFRGKDRSIKKLEKNKRFKRNQRMRKNIRIDARIRRG